MTKKYDLLRKKVKTASGELIEAFEIGLVEFSCLGERHYDLAGYPYESEMEALGTDWARLRGDAIRAREKFKDSLAIETEMEDERAAGAKRSRERSGA